MLEERESESATSQRMRNQVEIVAQIAFQLQQHNPQVDRRAGRDCIKRQQGIPYQEKREQDTSCQQNRQQNVLANHRRLNQSSNYPLEK